MIVFHFNQRGGRWQAGFASYGRDRALCKKIGKVADAMLDALTKGKIAAGVLDR